MPAIVDSAAKQAQGGFVPANGSPSLSDGTTPADHGLAVLSFKTRDGKNRLADVSKTERVARRRVRFALGIERRTTT